MHRRDAIAAALLAGGNGDLLPVRMARRRALALGSRHGRGGEQGMDLRDAELDALSHRKIHAFAARDALREHQAKRRLALDRAMREYIDQQFQSLDRGDARRVLAAATVEEGDVIAGVYAQHMHRVMRALFRQRTTHAGAKRGVDVKARHARIFA